MFFTKILGANLANSRWSWGAYNPVEDTLFLRVWKDRIESIQGRDYIEIINYNLQTNSPGFSERKQHIEQLKSGTQGYGVLCIAKRDLDKKTAKILSFDDKELIRFGNILSIEEKVYAMIDSKVMVTNVSKYNSSFNQLSDELKQIFKLKSIENTTKESLILARLGQGRFRSSVLKNWDYRCSVTGVSVLGVIRASHIKPWRECSHQERLDPENGLALTANLDALFDIGLITFSDEGVLLTSNQLNGMSDGLIPPIAMQLNRAPTKTMQMYLNFHRNKIFRN